MWAITWQNVPTLSSKSFKCGHCNQSVASEKWWRSNSSPYAHIYLCHYCGKPSFIDGNWNKTPGTIFGNDVLDIDNKLVEALYREARECTWANAFTATVLACRKLLMHIAVDKWAAQWKKFIEYVQYLSDQNYVPPWAKDRVDHIRHKGNEANHEIVIMSSEDAKDLLSFIEMILKLVYEFPANIKKKTEINQ